MNMTIPPDIFAQEHKKRSAEVNRLRDWAGSDNSKTAELAQALVELSAHRLRGHLFKQAVGDAQQALSLSVKVMISAGPLGPYTPASAASRVVVAAIHLAAIQTQAGQIEGAELTLGSSDAIRSGAAEHGLVVYPTGESLLWEQISRARIALANGDGGLADQWISAADGGELFQELDRLTTLAATRWALGDVPESTVAAWHAVQEYDAKYLPVLLAKGINSARAIQLAQPLIGIYSDLADRLISAGETEAGLIFRGKLVEYLSMLASNHRSTWRDKLAAARRWWADDLVRAGYREQADQLFDQAGVNQAPARALPELPEQSSVPGQLTYSDELAEEIRTARARAAARAREAEVAAQTEQARLRLAEQELAVAKQQNQVENETSHLADTGAGLDESRNQVDQAHSDGPTRAQLDRAARIAAHEQEILARQAELAAEAMRTEDRLASAKALFEAARVSGNKQGAFAAAQAVVDELRIRFAIDPGLAAELVEALKELAVVQRQNGDWWGSRKPAKEAKDLAKRMLS